MDLITVKATSSLGEIADADKVPTEFVLLRAGENEYEGGKLVFDAEAAKLVIENYERRGLKLKADYEHQSMTQPPVIAPASAKSWTPIVRNGELLASDIKWTSRAKQMIADGEYGYFSIAARIDPKSRRIAQVINFALTNTPAANGIQHLFAASLPFSQKETPMKTVIVALGLGADAEEAAAVSKATRLVELERDVLLLTGKSSAVEALGALTAMKSAHEQVVALTAQVGKLESERTSAEVKALLDAADKDRKLAPAKRPELEQLAAKSGIDALKVCLSMMAPLVDAKDAGPSENPTGADAAPTPEEYAVAKAFVGDDPEAIKKRIADVRGFSKGKA